MKDEIKVVKFLQNRAESVASMHSGIEQDLNDLKQQLQVALDESCYLENNASVHIEYDVVSTPLTRTSFLEIVAIANSEIPESVGFRDILSDEDLVEVDSKINSYINVFNKKHQLDGWDYAIGGGVGVFCGILDVLFVQKPLKPTAPYSQKVNGIFNQWSQSAINNLIPPELSKQLEKKYKIGGADSRSAADIMGNLSGSFNPINHRFKSLAHDPVLALFIGALDVMNGTCTIFDEGTVKVSKTAKGTAGDFSFFEALGMMLGHLASDFNAPSAKGNRGMGLPAPLMGLFGSLKGVQIGEKDIATLAEYMYVQGYDARHFVTMSIPVLISEVLIRVLYISKEMKYNNRGFTGVFMETLPFNVSPRFRLVLNISYGTMVAINSGKIALSRNILDANYAMWMAFTWHTFHSLYWLLWAKSSELQGYIDDELSKELADLQLKIDDLSQKAEFLQV
jgi:hypothetical protein